MTIPRKLQRLWRRARRIEGLEEYLLDHLGELIEGAEGSKQDFERFHWGETPDDVRELEAPEVHPWDVLTELGELAEVAYDTTKAGEPAIWVHAFEAPKPVLASTTDGGLVVLGGSYRITERGIVG